MNGAEWERTYESLVGREKLAAVMGSYGRTMLHDLGLPVEVSPEPGGVYAAEKVMDEKDLSEFGHPMTKSCDELLERLIKRLKEDLGDSVRVTDVWAEVDKIGREVTFTYAVRLPCLPASERIVVGL